LSCHRGYRFGNWCVGLGGPIDRPGRRLGLGGLGVLEVLEDFEGTEIHAVSRINAPLNAGKGIESGMESVAEGGIVLDGGIEEIGVGEIFVEAFDLVIPELGFDAAEAALDPFGGDEGVDEGELDWVGGVEVEHECGGEGFEFGGILAGDDMGPGVDSGFEGIERGGGFAFGRGGTGGFLGVEAIGVDLSLGRHGLVSAHS